MLQQPTPPHKMKANRRRTAAAAVELACVLPLFLTLVFSMMEFGHAQMIHNMLRVACRTGARYGATTGVSTEQVRAKVLGILSPVVPAGKVEVIVKNAGIYDEVPLPESANDLVSLPDIDLGIAEPQQLFVISAKLNYRDVAVVRSLFPCNLTLQAHSFTRHE